MQNIVKLLTKRQNGFTLLELLVSISIIGVLISLGAVSYSTAQKKARDSKRQGDLRAIQNALEQYYSICGYVYPTAMPAAGSPITCPTGSVIVLEAYPVDPKTASPYPSTAALSTSSYSIGATGEIVSITPVKNKQ